MPMHLKTDLRAEQREAESSAVERDDRRPPASRVVRETVSVSMAAHPPGTAEFVQELVSVARPRRVGSLVRILFGLIWGVDAYFKWQPSFLSGLQDLVSGGAKGQPGWLVPWFNFAKGVIALNPTLWAYGIAVVETGIALVLILGLARKCLGAL